MTKMNMYKIRQMSLDTKRAEIRKLDQRALQREEALKKSEQMLEEDSVRFDMFLKENDEKVQEAMKRQVGRIYTFNFWNASMKFLLFFILFVFPPSTTTSSQTVYRYAGRRSSSRPNRTRSPRSSASKHRSRT